MAWQPEGAGNSIAVLGLLGGLFAYFLRQWPAGALGVRTLVLLALAGGAVLAAGRDIHGPALLAGALLGMGLAARPITR